MSDAWINPVTGDYKLTPLGAPTRDPAGGLGNAVYLRLETPLGSYWADAALGSRLHEIQREKDLARIEILARQYAHLALAPIIKDGRAKAIDIATERIKLPAGGARLNLLIEVTDAAGNRLTFIYPVKVI